MTDKSLHEYEKEAVDLSDPSRLNFLGEIFGKVTPWQRELPTITINTEVTHKLSVATRLCRRQDNRYRRLRRSQTRRRFLHGRQVAVRRG